MNAQRMNFPILGVALLLFSGCAMMEGWNTSTSADDSQAQTQQAYFEERIQTLTARIAGLEQSNANLQRDLSELQVRVGQLQSGAGGQATATELQQLRDRLAQLDIQREKDKHAILDQLAKEIAGLAGSRRSASSGGSSGSSDVGYEHTVKQGDTLAALAKRYGTTVTAIKKANNLSSDTLRIGQKLFVPKP